ncbi:MAG: ArsA family ATPase [Candidatus Omnitrophota bacterium]|nr:ArsA family ATPase [Candidatus Omnitrophota bacterium]
MALTGLKEDVLKLILFGGKGGVGKTTCASSTGLYLAKDFKTLLISTDPAHSLSDSLGQEIGSEIKEVKGVKNLSALEISAEKALSKFKIKYETQIRKILDTSTYLDQEDIDSIFSLPIPGIDEVMGFKTIVDLIEQAQFEKYIVDTAPTGHALRLLTLPELLDDWIKVMAKMRWKYRYMVETFSGKYNPDEGDDFLVEMKKTVNRIEGLLRDGKACEFIAVTIPEDMAIQETERLVNNLNKFGLKVKQLVVNNVLHPSLMDGKVYPPGLELRDCEFCRERIKAQEEYIKQIRRKFSNLKTTIIPLQPREVKGIEALDKFTGSLFQ